MFKYKDKNHKKIKRAFSFIEVILVVAIIGIMASIILAYVGQNKHMTELETAANEIVASIRKIQNYSLTGKDIVSGCAEYRFIAIATADNFTIDNGDSPTCSFNKNYQLKNDVKFVNPVSLVFNAPFGNRTASSTVDINITKSGNNYHICVTGVGVVTMQSTPC